MPKGVAHVEGTPNWRESDLRPPKGGDLIRVRETAKWRDKRRLF